MSLLIKHKNFNYLATYLRMLSLAVSDWLIDWLRLMDLIQWSFYQQHMVLKIPHYQVLECAELRLIYNF
jgi:hypothetical protein